MLAYSLQTVGARQDNHKCEVCTNFRLNYTGITKLAQSRVTAMKLPNDSCSQKRSELVGVDASYRKKSEGQKPYVLHLNVQLQLTTTL